MILPCRPYPDRIPRREWKFIIIVICPNKRVVRAQEAEIPVPVLERDQANATLYNLARCDAGQLFLTGVLWCGDPQNNIKILQEIAYAGLLCLCLV